MCWGTSPTAKWSTTSNVVGSMTSTVSLSVLGTYPRVGTPATAGLRSAGPVWSYTPLATGAIVVGVVLDTGPVRGVAVPDLAAEQAVSATRTPTRPRRRMTKRGTC